MSDDSTKSPHPGPTPTPTPPPVAAPTPTIARPADRSLLQELGLALLVGAVVGLLLWIAGGAEGALLPSLLGAAWIGLWIYGLCALAEVLFRGPLERLPPRGRRLALGGVFFVAGMVAWGAAMATLPWITFGWLSTSVGGSLDVLVRSAAFAGLLGLTLGLTFLSFQLLQDRLRDSVARLKEQEFALRELDTAREIQQRLLPPGEIPFPGYRVTARSEPAQVVAGDFYDAFSLPDGSFAVAVGDVAGKGMGASLLMASVKAMLPLVAMEGSAAQTLRELNRRLSPDLGPRQFVALAFARVDPATGDFRLANAGLPDPYRLGDGETVEELVVPGPRLPLGVRDEVEYEELAGRLGPGERLLMLSDGLPEAALADGELLGYDGLARLLAADGGLAGAAGLADLFRRLQDRTASERDDDWTALLLEPSPHTVRE